MKGVCQKCREKPGQIIVSGENRNDNLPGLVGVLSFVGKHYVVGDVRFG